jgi:hypothetical protein
MMVFDTAGDLIRRNLKRRYETKSRGSMVSALKRRAKINPPLRGEVIGPMKSI